GSEVHSAAARLHRRPVAAPPRAGFHVPAVVVGVRVEIADGAADAHARDGRGPAEPFVIDRDVAVGGAIDAKPLLIGDTLASGRGLRGGERRIGERAFGGGVAAGAPRLHGRAQRMLAGADDGEAARRCYLHNPSASWVCRTRARAAAGSGPRSATAR